ncbi:MAG: CAP domain-containing protein [Solirubrobacteraceae bacterium]
MARLRVVSVAGPLALCVCLCAAISLSQALAAPVVRSRLHTKTSPGHAPSKRAGRCAKASSFHLRGGQVRRRPSGAHVRHRRGLLSCPKPPSGARHRSAARRGHGRTRRSESHRRTHQRRSPSRPKRAQPKRIRPKRAQPKRIRPERSHAKRTHAERTHAKRTLLSPANLSPRRSGAANAASCPDIDLIPSAENLERVREATLCLVNRERTANGENPLQLNARLEQAAQAHSESMGSGDYFEHVGPGGDTPLDRMRAAGYIYSSRIGYEIGENIGFGTLWEASPRAVVAAWMASPGHRANILDASFKDTAIGVCAHPPSSLAGGQQGAVYTQDFGVIITG